MTDYLERARIARVAKRRLLGQWLDDMIAGKNASSRQPCEAKPVPEPS